MISVADAYGIGARSMRSFRNCLGEVSKWL